MPDQVSNYQGLPGIKGISQVARQKALEQEAALDNANFYKLVQQQTEDYIKNSYLYNYTHPSPYKQTIDPRLLPDDFGESRYDKYVTSIEDLADLNSFRSNQQSGLIQFVNGVVKGITTAGTTYIDGILGTVYGIFYGINAASSDELDNPYLNDAQEFLGGFVNNPINLRMREFNQFMEEFAPNYRTFEEMQKPWWQRAFSKGFVNFWADDIIKNVGFSIGALGAAATWNAAGQGLKTGVKSIKNLIPSTSKGIVQAIDNPSVGSQIVNGLRNGENIVNPLEWMKKVSSAAHKAYKVDAGLSGLSLLLGATGEAQIEALESASTFRESQLSKATKYFKDTQSDRLGKFLQDNPQYLINGQLSLDGQKAFQTSEDNLLNDYKDKVEAEAVRVGNNVFAYQTVLLSLTNAAAYSKLFGAGYSAQSALSRQGRRFIEFDKAAGKYGVKTGLQKAANIAKITSNPLLEGGEELGQAFISRTAEAYFDKELNTSLMHEDLADKESNNKVSNLINALTTGAKESFFNEDAWLEFTSGFLMGAVGVPTIGRRKSGRVGVKLAGGIAADIREVKEYNSLRQQAVDNLNEYLSKPENQELFKAAVLNQKYTKEMEEALEMGNPLLFKDNEHKAIMSIATAYQSANKINDFYSMIDSHANLSDEDINQLKIDTTDKKTKKSIYDNMSNDEIRTTVSNQAKQVKDKVKAFIDLTNDMFVLYGNKFSRETLHDISFNMSLANEKRERSIQLANEIKETLNKSLGDEMKIVDTQDLNAVLKSIESFGNLEKIKKDYETYKKKHKDFKEDTTSTYAVNVKEKTGLSIDEFHSFIDNLEKRANKQIYQGIKNRGLDTKVKDLYLNIVSSRYNLISFAQALSDPKAYMQKVTQYYANILKEEHDKQVKDIGDIDNEAAYNEAMNKLSPESQDAFEKEHIKSGAKAQAFAKKRQAQTKLVNTVETYLNDKSNKHSDASKALVKKAFENNKETFKVSIEEGMKAVEAELAGKSTTHVKNVLAGIKEKISEVEEIKAFYSQKVEAPVEEKTDETTNINPEELKANKEAAVKAANDLLAFRAEKTESETLYKMFMEGKSSNFTVPFSVDYINADEMENVSINETDENGKVVAEPVRAKFRIRVDYATNKTQVYVLKPSVAKNLGSSNQAFEDYAQKTPATYSVDGWGITIEQLKAALLAAGVRSGKVDSVTKDGINAFLDDQKDKGFLSTDWSNTPQPGDEELVKAYQASIKKVTSPVNQTSETKAPIITNKPADDFIVLEGIDNKNYTIGYKQTTDVSGTKIYTIHAKTKDGQNTEALYPWITMKNSSEYISASEVAKLPKEFKNKNSFKLHKIYERITPQKELLIIAELIGEGNKIVSTHLNKNYILDRVNKRAEKQALKTSISTFSGSKNFSVTEYDFRDDFENQAKESVITNDTDQFIYDVLKARGAYDFVNNGSLYKLWKANKDLQVKYVKINEARDSSTIKLNKADGVYFMYVEVDGRNQIVGNVKKDSEIYNKLIEAEKKGEQLVNTIRDFKAGDVAVDETVERDVAELMHSNQPPILAMITLSEDKQNPTLHVQDGVKVTLNDIAGIHNWGEFSNAPVLLIPSANGKYIPRVAEMLGISHPNFIVPVSDNKLVIDSNNAPIMKTIDEAITTISKITMKGKEAFDNETYQQAKQAIDTLNELLLFRDSNKNYYKIDLYYNEESDEYFVSVHLKESTAKRRFLDSEWETFVKYGAKAMKVNSEASVSDGNASSSDLKDITSFLNEKIASNDKRATITLDINDSDYNYKQLLSLINAINPLFNFDKQAFNNQQGEGITAKDWIDNGLLTTTVKLGRTYNGLFFINDDVKADTVRSKESFESNKKQFLNIGFTSGTSLGYDIEFEYTAPTLIFKSVVEATGKTTNRDKGLANVFGIKPKTIDLTNQKDFEQFETKLKEYLRTNVDVSAYAVKNPNKEEYFFEVMINGEYHHYVVYKEYDKKGKLIDKKENIVPISSTHEGFIEMLEIMSAQNEDDDVIENPNVEVSEIIKEQPIAKEQSNNEKEVTAKFNYSDKFTPQTKIIYEKKEITLEEYLKIIENSPNPVAKAKLFIKIADNKQTLIDMNISKKDFIDLSKKINKYAEAYVAIQDNNESKIKDICKKNNNI